MSKNIEVEIKYQVLNEDQIKKFLEQFKFEHEIHVVDDYLDTIDAILYQRGIFIRVRNGKTLDIKFNPYDVANPDKESDHGHCDEYSYDLPFVANDLVEINRVMDILQMNHVEEASLECFMKANDLVYSIHFDKTRKVYKSGIFEIVYDDLRDFDNYVEIEASGNDANIEDLTRQIKEFIQGLDLKLITTGYNELYWRKKDFEVYKKGRFFLEEDRELFWQR